MTTSPYIKMFDIVSDGSRTGIVLRVGAEGESVSVRFGASTEDRMPSELAKVDPAPVAVADRALFARLASDFRLDGKADGVTDQGTLCLQSLQRDGFYRSGDGSFDRLIEVGAITSHNDGDNTFLTLTPAGWAAYSAMLS